MARGGGARACQFPKRNERYGEAWRAHAPGLEDAPFPLRRQSNAGCGAGRFGLLAREDPLAAHGPASPFRAVAPMLEAGPRLPGPGSMTAR